MVVSLSGYIHNRRRCGRDKANMEKHVKIGSAACAGCWRSPIDKSLLDIVVGGECLIHTDTHTHSLGRCHNRSFVTHTYCPMTTTEEALLCALCCSSVSRDKMLKKEKIYQAECMLAPFKLTYSRCYQRSHSRKPTLLSLYLSQPTVYGIIPLHRQ